MTAEAIGCACAVFRGEPFGAVFHRGRSRRSYARQKRTTRPKRKYLLFLRGLTTGTRCGSPGYRPSPIDILYEESYFPARRSTEHLYERSYERKEDRSLTGHPRHVGPQGAGSRPYAWTG